MNWYFWILPHLLMKSDTVVDMVQKSGRNMYLFHLLSAAESAAVDDFKVLLERRCR